MLKYHHHVTAVVTDMRQETARVRSYELRDPDNWELPPFGAGAHVDIRLENGIIRQYSLCSDPGDRNFYRIAVQAEAEGRGGSLAVQDQLRPGAKVALSLPRNHFPLHVEAARHILVAGGIGITPFISMMEQLDQQNTEYILHYCGRDPASMAFHDLLLQPHRRGKVYFHYSETDQPNLLDLSQLAASAQSGDHLYCCGPGALIDAFLSATCALPPDTVHYEKFGGAAASGEGDIAFSVELASSGRTIDVGTHETILEALRRENVEVDASCEAGVCAACKTRYLSGTVIHRDLLLKGDDQKEFLIPCVSRCAGDKLVLDL